MNIDLDDITADKIAIEVVKWYYNRQRKFNPTNEEVDIKSALKTVLEYLTGDKVNE